MTPSAPDPRRRRSLGLGPGTAPAQPAEPESAPPPARPEDDAPGLPAPAVARDDPPTAPDDGGAPTVPAPDGDMDVGARVPAQGGAPEERAGAGRADTGRTDTEQADAGRTGAGQADAGRTDTGQAGAGREDAGRTGAGQADAGRTDTGQADAGREDAGRAGAEQVDAGRTDTGQAGAGREDAGRTDTEQADAGRDDGRFRVVLENFEGPFDLLLQLISRHKMDVTEVALSRVTDEFMAHIRAMGPDWDLDQATEFLVVAATLLDLKAARLLPAAEVEDEADLALLEARDLLFARLLQYRAFKKVAEILAARLAAEAHRRPRTVGLEPHHAELLPEVVIRLGPEGFARLAVKAMQPKPRPQVYVDHIHAPLVSVREQAGIVVRLLREAGEATFAELTRDAPDTLTVVARFLALLELYRERAVVLDQEEALGPLLVRWSGTAAEDRPLVTDEFDQEAAAPDARKEPQP